MKTRSFISGCEATQLSSAETAFFREQNPWGLILFKRNCETPAQIAALTAAFREAVGLRDAPVFIDQEGGRVQRLGPPSADWRKYPSARAFGEWRHHPGGVDKSVQDSTSARTPARNLSAEAHLCHDGERQDPYRLDQQRFPPGAPCRPSHSEPGARDHRVNDDLG